MAFGRARGQSEGDIFQAAQMRPEGEILEHHAKAAALRRHENPPRIVHQPAIDFDAAGIGAVQPGDHSQGGGFAGAGFASQHQEHAVL
jgi:hypothetical protein